MDSIYTAITHVDSRVRFLPRRVLVLAVSSGGRGPWRGVRVGEPSFAPLPTAAACRTREPMVQRGNSLIQLFSCLQIYVCLKERQCCVGCVGCRVGGAAPVCQGDRHASALPHTYVYVTHHHSASLGQAWAIQSCFSRVLPLILNISAVLVRCPLVHVCCAVCV